MPPSIRKRNHPDNDDDGDVGDIKVIPFKRQNMNYSQEEEVKTIKIVKDSSPAQWRKLTIMGQKVRLFLLCSVTFFLLMLQNFPICHLKGLSNAFQNIWCKKYIYTILCV